MLTKIGKCLAVLTVFLSLAFAGFAMISMAAGTNWQAKADQLTDYTFALSEGENPQWTVTLRLQGGPGGGQAVKNPANILPQKVIDALDDIKARQQTTLTELNNRLNGPPELKARVEEARVLKEIDVPALERHEQELAAELARVSQQVHDLSAQVEQKTREAYAKRSEAAERREDMYRLRNQVEEIRADTDRTIAQQTHLRDLLNRTYGIIGRLERRTDEIQQKTGPAQAYPDEQPSSGAGQ